MWLPFINSNREITLPQHDQANSARRQREIKKSKAQYEWTHEGIGSASMIKGLPWAEFPELGWLEKLIQTVLRISLNNATVGLDETTDAVDMIKGMIASQISSFSAKLFQRVLSGQWNEETVKESISEIANMMHVPIEGKGRTFQDYKDLFKVLKPDQVSFEDQFLQDEVFGWYRVAGPNPMRLTMLTERMTLMFPGMTDVILRGISAFKEDSLEELEREDRLFYVSYSEFEGLPTGVLSDGTKKDYLHIYSPLAVLGIPKNPDKRVSVLPIAIRCGVDPDTYPMYTPNTEHTDPVTWLAAKLTVQIADALSFETIYHLGRVHLLLEVFVCSMNRCLASTHPLNKLLKVHLYGTGFINFLAIYSLTAPDGPIDRLTAPQIETICKIAAESINQPSFQFNDWFPDKELASRGLLDAPQLHFPFRDDSQKLWKAILDWAQCYVGAYYKSDEDVRNDSELSEWCRDITDPEGGSLHGFGETEDGQILTVSYLAKMVAMVIYTSTVQHAAVNFTQGKFLQFTPAMPLGGYAPAPTTEKPFKTIDHWVEEMMPNLQAAVDQLETAELIGVMKYTVLGEYGRDLSFIPQEVEEGLQDFQEALSKIDTYIQTRNHEERRVGLPVYDVLLPKNIPQSTNI